MRNQLEKGLTFKARKQTLGIIFGAETELCSGKCCHSTLLSAAENDGCSCVTEP